MYVEVYSFNTLKTRITDCNNIQCLYICAKHFSNYYHHLANSPQERRNTYLRVVFIVQISRIFSHITVVP